MSIRPRSLLLVLGLTVGCTKPNTVLEITVTGHVPGLRQLRVALEIGGTARPQALLVPATPTPLALPTSFSVETTESGSAKVSIEALDAGGSVRAKGMATLASLDKGKRNRMRVDLGEGSPKDAGVDFLPPDSGADEGAEVAADVDDETGDAAEATDAATDDADAPVETSPDVPVDQTMDAADEPVETAAEPSDAATDPADAGADA